MPRTYTRRLGARYYRNYTDENLEEAVNLVMGKQLPLRKASSRFNIHRNTLWLKIKERRGLKEKPTRAPGGQP